jgi:hypothetical protein
MIRPLNQQFDAEAVRSIRALIDRIGRLYLPTGSSRYYAVELAHCLEAGLLLGSLHVAASLLELVVRGTIAERLAMAHSKPTDWEHRLEEMRHLGFSKLIDYLVNAGLFEEADGDSAKGFYNAVRIPIHHGLPRRYVTHHDETKAFMKEFIGISMLTTSHDLEDVIEDFAVPQIDIVVGIIERNST